jgi:Arm DNA-binding domain
MTKLTARAVAAAKRPGMLGDGGGLYLRIGPGRSKSWVFRYMKNGGRHDLGLGGADAFSLAEARERAVEAKRALARGVDPLAAKRAERDSARLAEAKAMTFAECAGAYIDAHRAGWRNPKHAAQWPSTLETYVYPTMGAAGPGRGRWARHEGSRADLDCEAGNRRQGARPD